MSEIFIASFFFIFLLLLGVVIWRFVFRECLDFKLFLVLIILKLGMSVSYGAIYSMYYTDGGDTFVYWKNSTGLWNLVNDAEYKQSGSFLSSETIDKAVGPDIRIVGTAALQADAFFFIKLCGVLAVITFHNYWSSSMILSFFSFFGLLYLFKALTYKIEKDRLIYLLPIFFIPSVLFWGSGLMKDTLILGAYGFLIGSLFFIIKYKYKVVLNLLIAVVMLWVLFRSRTFMFIIITPLIFIWIALTLLSKIRDKRLKAFSFISIAFLFHVFSIVGAQLLGAYNPELSLGSQWKTAIGFQRWHHFLAEQNSIGSGYTLTELEPSFFSVVQVFFESLTTSIYRPFIWEANNALSVLASLEGLLYIIATIYVVLRFKFIRFLKVVFNDPFLIFIFLFSVSFLAITGFISYNFGAMVRYRLLGILSLNIGLCYTIYTYLGKRSSVEA